MRNSVSLLILLLFAFPQAAAAQDASVRGIALSVLSQHALVRSALGSLLPPERSVWQMGLALTLPTPWSGLRAEGRILRSEVGNSDLRSLDAGLVFSWRALGVAAAYGQRGSYDPQTGLAHSRDADFARLGLRLRLSQPTALFVVHLRGDHYIPTPQASTSADALSGWEAEGGVTWRAKDLPLSASLGYRLERFKIFSVAQEVSALTLALGIALGAR